MERGPHMRYRISTEAVSNRLGENTVLVHLKTDRILELNRTASRLWELISAGLDRSQIQATMIQEFDVSEPVLTREIDATLGSLQSENFISIDNER
jgi:hypothetical protein